MKTKRKPKWSQAPDDFWQRKLIPEALSPRGKLKVFVLEVEGSSAVVLEALRTAVSVSVGVGSAGTASEPHGDLQFAGSLWFKPRKHGTPIAQSPARRNEKQK